MAIINSKKRKNDGGEFGILGGRPPIYDWEAFKKEMEEEDPDQYYLSPHMKKWCLDNWGKTEEEIQRSFRKTLWNKFGKNPATTATTPEKQKAYRQSTRGKLGKRLARFKTKSPSLYKRAKVVNVQASLDSRRNTFNKRKGEGKVSNLTTLINHLEKTQNLNLETNTIEDYYTREIINLTEDSWQLDHIDPQGGNNVENCGLTLEQYNQMKNAWTIEETLNACEKLLKNLRPDALKNSS
tara:strand:+ start:3049 stop:3765 length:717 start_codon:yes stop_codon:yes gene_type:complete